MKSLPFLFLFLVLLSPFRAFSQDLESEELAPEISEEEFVASDELAAVVDNADVGEMEKQEDMIHPEGENEWSLGGEDLPAEEFE
jgi:hypothetical protein